MDTGLIIAIVIAVLVLIVVARAVRIVPQATAAVVERLGRYDRTLSPGLALLVPFVDRIRANIDLREQVVSFPPQPVITADNLQVGIDTVIYFQVTDPRQATYGIANFIQAIEQLTVTTLRNVVGGLALEETLISRDQINSQLRAVLDGTTGTWGVRVARVEIKAIDPPPSIQESMEKQMKADRDKRAMILNAEGQRESLIRTAQGSKQSAILTAEGAKQAAILNAEADRQSRILRAEGERASKFLQAQGQAKAIETVFQAIHDGNPDPRLLAYQYLQTLPQIAQGDANKVWIVPSEFSNALKGLGKIAGGDDSEDAGSTFANLSAGSEGTRPGTPKIDTTDWFDSNLSESVANASAAADVELPEIEEPLTGLPTGTSRAKARGAAPRALPSVPQAGQLPADYQPPQYQPQQEPKAEAPYQPPQYQPQPYQDQQYRAPQTGGQPPQTGGQPAQTGGHPPQTGGHPVQPQQQRPPQQGNPPPPPQR